MEGRGNAARAQKLGGGIVTERQLRPAFKILRAEANALKPACHRVNMPRLTVVRRTSERDLIVAQVKPLRRPAFDKR